MNTDTVWPRADFAPDEVIGAVRRVARELLDAGVITDRMRMIDYDRHRTAEDPSPYQVIRYGQTLISPAEDGEQPSLTPWGVVLTQTGLPVVADTASLAIKPAFDHSDVANPASFHREEKAVERTESRAIRRRFGRLELSLVFEERQRDQA